jgi:hypothetical protein
MGLDPLREVEAPLKHAELITIIKVDKPYILKSIPVITAAHIKNKKIKALIPAFCIAIFLVLKMKKNIVEITEIMANPISRNLYRCIKSELIIFE